MSGNAFESRHFRSLTRAAYQELATKNAENLTAGDAGAGRSEKPGGVHRMQQRPIKNSGAEAAVSG